MSGANIAVRRPCTAQESRYNTHFHLHLRAPVSKEVSHFSTTFVPFSTLSQSSSSDPQRSKDELTCKLLGEEREDDTYPTFACGNVSPELVDPLKTAKVHDKRPGLIVSQQSGLSQVPVMPQCHSGACTWCMAKADDHASAAVAVSGCRDQALNGRPCSVRAPEF